jgi:hypothetical protein
VPRQVAYVTALEALVCLPQSQECFSDQSGVKAIPRQEKEDGEELAGADSWRMVDAFLKSASHGHRSLRPMILGATPTSRCSLSNSSLRASMYVQILAL